MAEESRGVAAIAVDMPQRFLRPGITTSKRYNACSWQAQALFTRLITLVDDFGRYEADPRLLRSHAFPFGDPAGKDIPAKSIEAWCSELANADLCRFYQDSHGKRYLQLTRWTERKRSDKSKYPAIEDGCTEILRNPAESCGILPPKSSPSPEPSPVHQRHSSHTSQAKVSEPDSDELWLKGLQSSPAYEGIDVHREHARMVVWCKTFQKQPTRRRFVRWLNKTEKPLRPMPKAKPIDPAKIELPSEFREWAKGKYPTKDAELSGYKTWADVPDWMRVEWKREKIDPLSKSIAA